MSDYNNRRMAYYLPIFLSLALIVGILIGTQLQTTNPRGALITKASDNKFGEILNYIEQEYVDTINQERLNETILNTLLLSLDPHSSYISPKDLQAVNEPLEGNFDGIGIEFNIINDSIVVVAPVSGGPSEALGIISGDRIVKIEGLVVAGKKITNEDVISKLRGKKGTKVNISIHRKSMANLLDFTITRGEIPIYSVDVAYMVDPKTGYIKISRFAASTHDEYLKAVEDLEGKGMTQLILDLRGNPGGYLNAATKIADDFLGNKKLIVYTEGKARPREYYYATKEGSFEQGKLCILIDEGSASASEIIAGAIQDNDRGTIIGRRSFGKGLVQEQTEWPDGSAIRLTVARYYTPTGRSIQKSYKNGSEAYFNEYYERFEDGELLDKDSIHFEDTLKYTTPGGKVVYGGGGIMPDIFVPIDSSGVSAYMNKLIFNGILNQFAFNYADDHRASFKNYPSFSDFNSRFEVDQQLFDQLVSFAEKKNIKADPSGIQNSKEVIKTQLKALIARQIWKNKGFYPIIHQIDNTFAEAVKVINE